MQSSGYLLPLCWLLYASATLENGFPNTQNNPANVNTVLSNEQRLSYNKLLSGSNPSQSSFYFKMPLVSRDNPYTSRLYAPSLYPELPKDKPTTRKGPSSILKKGPRGKSTKSVRFNLPIPLAKKKSPSLISRILSDGRTSPELKKAQSLTDLSGDDDEDVFNFEMPEEEDDEWDTIVAPQVENPKLPRFEMRPKINIEDAKNGLESGITKPMLTNGNKPFAPLKARFSPFDVEEEKSLLKNQTSFQWQLQLSPLTFSFKTSSNSIIESNVLHLTAVALESYLFINYGISTSWSPLDIQYCAGASADIFMSDMDLFSELLKKKGVGSSNCSYTQHLSMVKKAGCASGRQSCTLPFVLPVSTFAGTVPSSLHLMYRVRVFGPVLIKYTFATGLSNFLSYKKQFDYSQHVYHSELHNNYATKARFDTPWASLVGHQHAGLLLGYGFEFGSLFWIIKTGYETELGNDHILYVSENDLGIVRDEVLSFQQVNLMNPLIEKYTEV